jgi:tetratricopeptide (TPR) repeat protein
MAAELNFKYARMYHLERDAFEAYFDTLLSTQSNPSECARNEYDYKYFYLSDLYHEMGNTYQNWKYYDKAKEYFYMNVQIQPEYGRSYAALWNLFEEQEKYDEAEEVINQFSAQYRKGGAIELYNFYKRRIEKNPNDIKYYIKAGKFLHFFAQQMDGYSETDYITIDKDNPDADFDFSEPKSTPTEDNSSRRYKEPNIDNPKKDAVVLLRKAIELASDSNTKAVCYDMIGDFYNWAGSKKRALQNYKNAVEQNPNQPDTRNKLIAFCNELYHFESGVASLLYLK